MVRQPKSKTGCLQCKTRKIKCDESKPSCEKCVRNRLSCSYLQYIPLGSKARQRSSTSLQRQDFPSAQTSSGLPYPTLRTNRPNISPRSQPKYFGTTFNAEDLRLLHFYTTQTSSSMLGPHMTGSNIWGTIIVTLSFSKTYLLHAIFALSALHLAFLHSAETDSHQQNLVERYLHLATLYQTKCITLFRREIADLSASNSAACAACASFLSLIVWATPGARGADLFLPSDTSSPASLNKQSSGESLCSTQPESNLKSRNKSVPWYKIQRGGHHIVSKTYDWVSASAYHDIVGPWREINYHHIFRYPLSTPISTISSSDAHNLADITSCWSDAELSDEDIQALEETLQTLHYVFNLLSLASTSSGIILPTPPTQISASIAALSWTTLLPSRFCDMVEDRIPQALILVAVYCVVLKRAEDLWWIKGKAESLLAAVGQELGGDGLWNKWLEWPRAEVEGC